MGIGDRDYMRRGSSFFSLGVIPTIIVINVVVFLAWQFADQRFMQENFLVSLPHLQSGRFWVMLTAAFSHNRLWHILINMFILYGFGRVLEQRWGSKRFVIFYLAACLISSGFHPLFTALGWPMSFALGASGAISGLIMCFAIYYPKATILLWAILPMPAWFLVTIGVGLDLWGLVEQKSGGGLGIGHAVHLGGALAGAVYVWVIERRGVFLPGARRKRTVARILRPDESPWQVSPRSERERRDRPYDPEDRILDELLEKVSQGGLDSLSIHERETLERISEKRRRSKR